MIKQLFILNGIFLVTCFLSLKRNLRKLNITLQTNLNGIIEDFGLWSR